MPTEFLTSKHHRLAALAALAATALWATALPVAEPTTEPAEPPLAEAPAELLAALEKTVVEMDMLRRFGIAEAPAKAAGSVRIAAYNVLNLFDTHDDPALTGDQDDAGMTKPLHESVAVARAIRAIDADILCLQEVESLQALTEFRDTLLADMGYEHIVSLGEAGDDRGIENAVLSRFPIVHTQIWPGMELGGIHPDKYGTQENWFAGQPVAFRRSPLRVDVQIPGSDEPWTLFVVHHKSGRFSEYWREAEAKAVVGFMGEITREHPDRPILVLGDFNAEPDAPSVRQYVSSGLDDIFANRPKTDAIVTHESGRRIDLILANPAAKAQLLADKAFVLGTAARPAGVSFRDLPTMPGIASDHYPVVVDTAPSEAVKNHRSNN
jgi:endonuclease/exonuclease/phosphatase family metal-dependent hydrolase